MAQVKHGDTMRVHYAGKFADGTVFETSHDREPLQYKIGEGRVLPGFEEAAVGMKPGEFKSIKIAAEDAYGPHRADLVIEIERSELPSHIKPQVGQQLQSIRENGKEIIFMVTDVSETAITLDANHPLTGEDLIFEPELVEIVKIKVNQ